MYKAIHLMYTFFNESTKWYIFNLYKFSIFTFKIRIFQKMYKSQRMKKTVCISPKKKKKVCIQYTPFSKNVLNFIHITYKI